MNRTRLVILRFLLVWLAASFMPSKAVRGQVPPTGVKDGATIVVFFDVSDLPARIDEPRLYRNEGGFVLKGAVANRSNEQLLGLRLILLVVEPSGKLRGRMAWTEKSEMATYSIKTFEFHPTIKVDLRSTDQIFLVIDEVIGHDTIWHPVEADKALRAYSRGQHDVMPAVQAMANKFDPPARALFPGIIY